MAIFRTKKQISKTSIKTPIAAVITLIAAARVSVTAGESSVAAIKYKIQFFSNSQCDVKS